MLLFKWIFGPSKLKMKNKSVYCCKIVIAHFELYNQMPPSREKDILEFLQNHKLDNIVLKKKNITFPIRTLMCIAVFL